MNIFEVQYDEAEILLQHQSWDCSITAVNILKKQKKTTSPIKELI